MLDAFRACSRGELAEVVRNSCELDVPPGRDLCQQGAFGRQAFVLVEGDAEVTVDGVRVTTLGPGSLVGETALLERQPNPASVTAITRLRVLVFSAREFDTVRRTVPTAFCGPPARRDAAHPQATTAPRRRSRPRHAPQRRAVG